MQISEQSVFDFHTKLPFNNLDKEVLPMYNRFQTGLSCRVFSSCQLCGGVDSFFYFCVKSRCIPCRIASPFEILCFSQYSASLFSVSASSLMLKRVSFGFSAFGLPVRGDIVSPLFFLSHLQYN